MLQDFRSFVARGNVLDLAIAVIIGAVTGGLDFSSYFIRLGEVSANYAGSPADYAALKKAGVPLLGYGSFLSVVINFLIIAIAVFMLVKAANRAAGMQLGAVPPTPEDTLLLREIRDGLAGRGITNNPLTTAAE